MTYKNDCSTIDSTMSFNFKETRNDQGKVIDTITVTSNYYLSLPMFFLKKNKLNRNSKPVLRMFFDEDAKAIGIVFTSISEDGTYKIHYSDKYGATCKIKSFLMNNNIDLNDYAGKYNYDIVSMVVDEISVNMFVLEQKNRKEIRKK